MLYSIFSLILTAAALRGALAVPSTRFGAKNILRSCPLFKGNFTIEQFQLYPENGEFDFKSCLLYVSNLYNGTMSVIDPYERAVVDIIEFPGISHTPGLFVSGLEIDTQTGLIAILANSGAAFVTQPAGSDISGPNIVMLWDPMTKKELWRINLTDTSKGVYGGFADVELDPAGNVYVNGMFPGTIMKLEKCGRGKVPKVKEWFLSQPRNTSINGFGGLAAKDWTLLTHNNADGQLLKFDMRSPVGKPVAIPMTPNTIFLNSDASYLPPKYNNTVWLISGGPGIRVLRSKDAKWNTAEFMGTVEKASLGLLPNHLATAVVQIGQGLNMLTLHTGDDVDAVSGGNRTAFPFIDITDRVEKLLSI
ncbi:hypothetical protein BKA61DRAFT_694018 [Leptodontidium sp. MPI-SDFR-AT-0119]|nr:hypothetical protein BKA61DRAFT_694018 [Leptodontidium sp. MPI-SDFR-AT-0119]